MPRRLWWAAGHVIVPTALGVAAVAGLAHAIVRAAEAVEEALWEWDPTNVR